MRSSCMRRNKVNQVNFSRKWGEDCMPIVDPSSVRTLASRYKKDCSWDTHMEKVTGKGRSNVGKTDAILTDSHLDTRMKTCMYPDECDSAKARICRRSMGRERETRKTAGNSTDDYQGGCTSTTRNTV